MNCKKKSAQALFGCLNTLLFVLGTLEVIAGFLLLLDPRRALLSRLLLAPEAARSLAQAPAHYAALALLAAGLAACAAAALGCWATYVPTCWMLTLYFLLVLSLSAAECAGGAAASLWPRAGWRGGPGAGGGGGGGGALRTLQEMYGVPDNEPFTAAVDLAQTELECCGVSDGSDYETSEWRARRLGPRGLVVPLSCCVQYIDGASYLNPLPVNRTRCQQDGATAEFRYLEGCLEKLEDWYQRQYIILLLALFLSSLFKLGLLLSTVFSCVRLKAQTTDTHSYIMRTIDNRSENIYERKMDEPITAKYIQPNNFYSPRVRNPHIFYNKPNEMM